MKVSIDTAALHFWFEKNKRDFPWRKNPTPYRVWISEVMLQQTRAAVVAAYFERWMKKFPSVSALAKAPLSVVIKMWEGLGYYSRARNLHEGALQIMAEYQGEIPSSREQLQKIKGLGPYTVNALLSFGFHKKAAAVDSNVIRLVSRVFFVCENISQSKVKRELQTLADSVLDSQAPWVTAEALIELGASICTPRPHCARCPLQSGCEAFRQDRVEQLPVKTKKKPPTLLKREVAVVISQDHVLLRKEVEKQVMQDLYEFPYFENIEFSIENHLLKEWGLEASLVTTLPVVCHHFTRFQAQLFPHYLKTAQMCDIPQCEWIPFSQLKHLPFSSGHRRVLIGLFEELL